MSIVKNKSINYYLIILIIFSLPYTNFPYTNAGTIKPLSLIFLSIYIPLNFYKFIKKKVFFTFFIIFILLSLYDLCLTMNIDFLILNSKPLRNQYMGFFQFFILGFFSYIAYYIGRYEIKKYFSEKDILFLVILAFYPSLIFGLIHTISVNLGFENPIFFIRDFFSSTIFPPDYYRNIMLTTEASFAATDLMVILLPVLLYYKKYNRYTFYNTIFLLSINLIGTKSGLGFLLLIATFVYIFFKSNIKTLFLYIIPIISISTLILFIFNTNLIDRVNKIAIVFSDKNNQLEESTTTRIVSYKIAIDIIQDYPFGIGYSNEGFYYSKYLDRKLLVFPLLSDWVNPNSKRFPDIKSTILKVITSFGVIGIVLIIYFLYTFYLSYRTKEQNNYRYIYNLFILNGLIMSFSISLLGYISFILLAGYFHYLLKEKISQIKKR